MKNLVGLVVGIIVLVAGYAPQIALAVTVQMRLNGRAYNDDGREPIHVWISEGQRIDGRFDIYGLVGLPSGEIVAFDGAVVWDGGQLFSERFRPVRANIELPFRFGEQVDLLRGVVPAGVPSGSYVLYVLIVRAGASPGVPAIWLVQVWAEPFRIVGPLPIPPFMLGEGRVIIDQVRLRGSFSCNANGENCSSTVPIGCRIEMSARNLSKDFVSVARWFELFDFEGNGIGFGLSGGSLNGSQAKVLTGPATATELPFGGADCSGIGSLRCSSAGPGTPPCTPQ
jgi:hypothetical protein